MNPAARHLPSAIRNWRLYRRLIGAQVRSQMQYRVSFAFEMLAQVFGNIVEFGAVAVFFVRAPALGGWSLGEVGLLYGLSTISFSLADMFSGGFDYDYFGPNMVQRGGLDQVLVRPVSAFLQVLASQFLVRRLGRMAQGLVILAVALSLLNVTWTTAQVAFAVVTVAGGILFFMGLFIIGSGLSFWIVEPKEVFNMFTYGGQTMTSYPMHIYQEWIRSIFTFVIPMAFVNYYPALWLLGKPDPLGGPAWLAFLSPVVCVAVFGIGVRLWWFGVSHYQSTGS